MDEGNVIVGTTRELNINDTSRSGRWRRSRTRCRAASKKEKVQALENKKRLIKVAIATTKNTYLGDGVAGTGGRPGHPNLISSTPGQFGGSPVTGLVALADTSTQ